MSGRKPRLTSMLRSLARDPRRSSLFHWMVEHHEELASATAAGRRLDWSAFRDKAVALGLRDADDRDPSERTLRDTWRRAKAEVDRLRKDRAKAEAALFPTLRRVPAMARPNPNVPAPIVTPHSRQPEATKDGGSLDALDRTLRRVSGREP